MKNKILILCTSLLVGALFIFQNVVADTQPDWVSGDTGFYPNNQYITASGSASNVELAKDRALANLVKIFELHIRQSSTTTSDIQVKKIDGKESYTKNQSLAERIQIRTDKVVQGARVAETWTDDSVMTYHALAVLDRKQAGANIREQMIRLDGDTDIELNRSQSQHDPLLAMSSLNKALSLQTERQALQNSLKVIDLSGRGRPASWSLADLKGQLEIKLQQLAIATAIDKDPIGRLDQALKSAMGNAGFAASNDRAKYTLVVNLDVQDLGMRQGWYWLRGKLSVKLLESSGKIRGRKQWPLKVSALQRNDSESRLMTQVTKTLNKNLKSAILSFATGVD